MPLAIKEPISVGEMRNKNFPGSGNNCASTGAMLSNVLCSQYPDASNPEIHAFVDGFADDFPGCSAIIRAVLNYHMGN